MKRVHGATVEQVVVDGMQPFGGKAMSGIAFRAVCLETGAVCDAYGFLDYDGTDEGAIYAALHYMGQRDLHEPGDHGVTCCLGATHVMAHDLPSKALRGATWRSVE